MLVLELTQTELGYLARMNHDSVLALEFLEAKGRQVDDLALSRQLEQKFLRLLPEGIPDVLGEFRSKQLKRTQKGKPRSTPTRD